MTFEEHEAFHKDLRQLTKRWPSLPEDLAVLKKVLAVMPAERPPLSVRIAGLKTIALQRSRDAIHQCVEHGVVQTQLALHQRELRRPRQRMSSDQIRNGLVGRGASRFGCGAHLGKYALVRRAATGRRFMGAGMRT